MTWTMKQMPTSDVLFVRGPTNKLLFIALWRYRDRWLLKCIHIRYVSPPRSSRYVPSERLELRIWQLHKVTNQLLLLWTRATQSVDPPAVKCIALRTMPHIPAYAYKQYIFSFIKQNGTIALYVYQWIYTHITCVVDPEMARYSSLDLFSTGWNFIDSLYFSLSVIFAQTTKPKQLPTPKHRQNYPEW